MLHSELDRVGLLKLVETREKGGILEKYYQPVAHEIGVNKALLSAQTSWAVGVVSYSRKALLKAKAAGTRLRINVVGMCHFVNDIDVSLADETIESFKIVGKVTASSEVREVLKHKEAQE
jgi:hypothetical protein